ncbi:MAG: hypothetical protein GTO03_02920 [Planctomycetales bacterium]|nr:hypothetical protein [Planctomycetales bacterium]
MRTAGARCRGGPHPPPAGRLPSGGSTILSDSRQDSPFFDEADELLLRRARFADF